MTSRSGDVRRGDLPGLVDGLHPRGTLALRLDAQLVLALAGLALVAEEDGEAVLQRNTFEFCSFSAIEALKT